MIVYISCTRFEEETVQYDLSRIAFLIDFRSLFCDKKKYIENHFVSFRTHVKITLIYAISFDIESDVRVVPLTLK